MTFGLWISCTKDRFLLPSGCGLFRECRGFGCNLRDCGMPVKRSAGSARGGHTLKIGGEIRRAHVNVADPAFDSISVTYANRPALLNNMVDSVSITTGNDVLGTRKWFYFGYIQDDFKVRPNFTLNLGLRYEYYSVNKEVNDRYRVFDLKECRGFCPHGSPWYFPDRNNFDPRIGFAWAPKALNGKTIIRTGGGIYHGPGQIDDVNTALDNAAERFSLTTAETPGLSYPVTPFLGLAREVGVTPRSLQRDRRDLYSSQWGLSIQQELPGRFVSRARDVGKCPPLHSHRARSGAGRLRAPKEFSHHREQGAGISR